MITFISSQEATEIIAKVKKITNPYFSVKIEYPPSLCVLFAQELRAIEEPKARKRQSTKDSLDPERGTVRDKIADQIGISSKTLQRAESVVAMAKQYPNHPLVKQAMSILDAPRGVCKAFTLIKKAKNQLDNR